MGISALRHLVDEEKKNNEGTMQKTRQRYKPVQKKGTKKKTSATVAPCGRAEKERYCGVA